MNYNSFTGLESLFNVHPVVLFLIIAWSLYWKGMALWKAARANDQKWFIAMLIVNLVGILEILYIYVFSKKKDASELPKA